MAWGRIFAHPDIAPCQFSSFRMAGPSVETQGRIVNSENLKAAEVGTACDFAISPRSLTRKCHMLLLGFYIVCLPFGSGRHTLVTTPKKACVSYLYMETSFIYCEINQTWRQSLWPLFRPMPLRDINSTYPGLEPFGDAGAVEPASD